MIEKMKEIFGDQPLTSRRNPRISVQDEIRIMGNGLLDKPDDEEMCPGVASSYKRMSRKYKLEQPMTSETDRDETAELILEGKILTALSPAHRSLLRKHFDKLTAENLRLREERSALIYLKDQQIDDLIKMHAEKDALTSALLKVAVAGTIERADKIAREALKNEGGSV